MEIINLIVVFLAGIAVAFVNTISAAGSLVSLSALMFAGLSPNEANATNRIPIIFQSFFSARGFESKGVVGDNYKWWLALASIPGAILGALFAVKIPGDVFNKILLVVMLAFLAFIVFNPVKVRPDNEERTSMPYRIAGLFIYFFIGLYGGFIQAGSGVFMMTTLLLLHRFNINQTNYYKVFVTLIYTFAALAIFFWKGNIHWYYGGVMSLGSSLGGWMTSRWSVSMNEVWMKRIIIGVVSLLAFYIGVYK